MAGRFHWPGLARPGRLSYNGPGPAMDRIIRINPLLEALRSAPERVNKVFVQEERGHARIGEVIREAKAKHVPCVFVPAKRLDQVAPGHQGVMAEVSPKG